MTILLEKIGKRLWEWLQTPLHPVVNQESRELSIESDIADQGIPPSFMPGFSGIRDGPTFTTQELWQFLGWESIAISEAALAEDLATIPWEDEIDDLSTLPWEDDVPGVTSLPNSVEATIEVPIEIEIEMPPEVDDPPLPVFIMGMDRISNWNNLSLPELFAQISWNAQGDVADTTASTASVEDLNLLGDLLITMPE